MRIGFYYAKALFAPRIGDPGDPGNGRPVHGYEGPISGRHHGQSRRFVPGMLALAPSHLGLGRCLYRVAAVGREGSRIVVHLQ